MHSFFQRFPNSDHLRQVDASDPEDFLAEATETLRSQAEAIADVSQQVTDGTLPVGMLAAAVRKTYTEVVVPAAASALH